MNSNNAPPPQDEEILLSLSDLWHICLKNRKKIIIGMLFFALVGAWFSLTKPLTYTAEATFKEKGKSSSGLNKSFTEMLIGNASAQESEAVSLMKSRRLTNNLVQRLGLQGVLKEKNSSSTLYKTIWNNLRVQYAHLRKRNEPLFQPTVPDISVKGIEYGGLVPISLQISFLSEDTFEVEDQEKRSLGTGKIGIPFDNYASSFTLIRNKEEPLTNRVWTLALDPLEKISHNLSQSFKISTDKNDKTLLLISYSHHDRDHAKQVLDELMAVYQEYLKEENDKAAQVQLDYLKKRQNETFQTQVELMESYALMLADDLSTTGIADTAKEMEFLLTSQQTYNRQLFAIDLEVNRLTDLKNREQLTNRAILLGNEGTSISAILASLSDLKQQKDSLSLALRQNPQHSREEIALAFEQQIKDYEKVRAMADEMDVIIDNVTKEQPLDKSLIVMQDPHLLINLWSQRLDESKKGKKEEYQKQKQNFISYLFNVARMLEVHKKLLSEKLSHQYNPEIEFQGIDLVSANNLYLEYCRLCSNVEADIRQNAFILEQLKDPQFEIFSLASVLRDEVSMGLLNKASSLALLLRDDHNRSMKEQERTQHELDQQRSFLKGHLEQTDQLLKLRQKLYQEKITSLQAVTLELIHQKISILEKHISDYIDSRIHHLDQERDLINKQLRDIHQKMAHLPHKWVWETIIKQNLATHETIVAEVTKLVEGKNISHHLEMIQSAPLDFALAGVLPNSPRLLLFILFGAGFGGFITAAFFLFESALYKGVQASKDNLQLSKQHVAGYLTEKSVAEPYQDADLDTLRRIVAFLETHKKTQSVRSPVLLLQGSSFDYSASLAKLLTKKGVKTLTLSLSFNQPALEDEQAGLLPYLEGKIAFPKIIQGKEGDRILAGGISRFSTELIGTKAFQELLKQLEKSYDCILAVSNTAPVSADAESLVSLFEAIVVSLKEERLQDLKPYFNSSKEKPITFVLTSL